MTDALPLVILEYNSKKNMHSKSSSAEAYFGIGGGDFPPPRPDGRLRIRRCYVILNVWACCLVNRKEENDIRILNIRRCKFIYLFILLFCVF